MTKNGLTPMGKRLDKATSDKLKGWSRESQNRVKSQIKADSRCFQVLTVLNDHQCFKTAVMLFNSEHEAVNYRDKFNQSVNGNSRYHKGYARLISPDVNKK